MRSEEVIEGLPVAYFPGQVDVALVIDKLIEFELVGHVSVVDAYLLDTLHVMLTFL